MPSSAPDPFSPARLGPLELRNRIIKSATFEGVMPRGQVTQDLIDFHVRLAQGGVAMTTVAYCAVSKGGRVSKDTMVFSPDKVPDLVRLTDAVHAEGAKVSAQIGHAGLVAQGAAKRTLAPSARLSAPAMGWVRAATPADLDQVAADYEQAVRVAIDGGFDAIELHLGHNYLLSSFLSPNLNKRKDAFGGSIENRLRYPRRIIDVVRRTADEASGGKVAVLAKFNMADGVEKGLWLEESLPMAKLLEADGQLHALELTGGSSLLNGMYFFRGDVPLRQFAAAQGPLVGVGVRLFGGRIFPRYPFEEGFFLPFARQFRAALKMPLVYLGGVNQIDTIEGALAEGFDFVAMARALLREPNLVNGWASGRRSSSLCIHCNRCLPTIYDGTRCVLVDPDPPTPRPLEPIEDVA